MSNVTEKPATFNLSDVEGNEQQLTLIEGQPLEDYFADAPNLIPPIEGHAAYVDDLLVKDLKVPVAEGTENIRIAFAPANG